MTARPKLCCRENVSRDILKAAGSWRIPETGGAMRRPFFMKTAGVICAVCVLSLSPCNANDAGNEIDRIVAAELGAVSATAGAKPVPVESADVPGAGKLSEELAQARAEIERLKDIVRRIYQANRREKADMYYNSGCVFRTAGMFQKSEEQFLRALELAPDDAAVHYNLGILYEDNLKLPGKAKTHYRRFLELAPTDADAQKVREWLSELGG